MNPQDDSTRVEAIDDSNEVIPGVSRAKAFFLVAAFLSFILSISYYFTGDHQRGIFVGIWVPSILSAGALLLGSERND